MAEKAPDIIEGFSEVVVIEDILDNFKQEIETIMGEPFTALDHWIDTDTALSNLGADVMDKLVEEYKIFGEIPLTDEEKLAVLWFIHTKESKGEELLGSELLLKDALLRWANLHFDKKEAIENHEPLIIKKPIEKHTFRKLAFVGSSTMARMVATIRNHHNRAFEKQYSKNSGGLGYAVSGAHLLPSIERKAKEVIDTGKYSTIALNGGSNDIYYEGKTEPEAVMFIAMRVVESLQRLVEYANFAEPPVQTVLVTIYERDDSSPEEKEAVQYVNNWILNEADVHAVLDQNTLRNRLDERGKPMVDTDGTHPSEGKDGGTSFLYKQIESAVIDENDELQVVKKGIEKLPPENVHVFGSSSLEYTVRYGLGRHSPFPERYPDHAGNMHVKAGRMLVPHPIQKRDTDYYRTHTEGQPDREHPERALSIENDVLQYISELDDSVPQTIVCNGGFNDMFNRTHHGDDPMDIAHDIIGAFQRIIDAATAKDFQIVLCTIQQHNGHPPEDPRNVAIEYVNDWLLDAADVHGLINFRPLFGRDKASDKFHPSYLYGKDYGVQRIAGAIEDMCVELP